jgi:hypothetical protein
MLPPLIAGAFIKHAVTKNNQPIEITMNKTTRTLLLACLAVSASPCLRADTNAAAAAAAPTPAPPYGAAPDTFFPVRLAEDFWTQMTSPVSTGFGAPPTAAAAPAPTDGKNPVAAAPAAAPSRRIGDPPFDSPPWPDPDWQIGGGPQVIGDPGSLRDSPGPLMQALYDSAWGKQIYDSRIMLYGWETVTANCSSSHNTGVSQAANFPEVYEIRPNRVEQDQLVVYLERLADMNQTDHIDWGFRFCFLYGLDYRFMASRGYLNDNNLFHNNNMYGFDTPMMYFNLYIPNICQGDEIIAGRIISMPDIEQQLQPNNLMITHSLLYAFDDYTLWGIWNCLKLNKNWVIQTGVSSGVDTAPWCGWKPNYDPGCVPTASVDVQYIATGGHDSAYVGVNSINNGAWGFNNLQEIIGSYTHKFNDRLWTAFEYQFMWNANAQTSAASPGSQNVPYVDGFYPVHDGFVYDTGLLNYTSYRLTGNSYISWRNEFWADPAGYRTGYAGNYYETTLGYSVWLSKIVEFQTEVRYDQCLNQNGLVSSTAVFNPSGAIGTRAVGPYNNGTSMNQVMVAFSTTVHF